MQANRLLDVLRQFWERDAEFIVVGGVSAVLNGAPVQTFDIDLVYSRSAENIPRLLAALNSLDAIFRIQPERRLRPAASHLAASGHLNLVTRSGPLDLLGTIGKNLGYDELIGRSNQLRVSEHIRVPVLDLETLIELKEALGAEKDLAVLPILRQTLKQKRRSRTEC